MPPRLLLDGEDLRALMVRVREEVGPDARIIKAERIRTGGIAGFFAKERYELTVEVPEVRPARRARPRRATEGAVGIDALLAAADAVEAEEAGGELSAPEPDPGPAVSTASDSFATVLDSVRQMVGADTTPVQLVDTIDGPEAPAGEDDAPQPAETETETETETALAVDPAPVDGAELAAVVGSGAAVAAERIDPPATETAPTPAAPAESGGSSVTALLELGIPTRLLQGFADPTAAAPLSVLVRRFERPPTVQLSAGVLVVAGEGDAALRTATQMAHRAGLPTHEILLAGEIDAVPGHGRRLQTLSAVERVRARLPEDVLTVIALGVPADRSRWGESAAMLEALAPDQAWAALDARSKPADLRRWLRSVGLRRRFDAVAAVAAFEAQAPGMVLSLGVPVGWLDGLPATPVVWAAVLSERLADDARWD